MGICETPLRGKPRYLPGRQEFPTQHGSGGVGGEVFVTSLPKSRCVKESAPTPNTAHFTDKLNNFLNRHYCVNSGKQLGIFPTWGELTPSMAVKLNTIQVYRLAKSSGGKFIRIG